VVPHPRRTELGSGGATNNVPADERLQLLVLISNTGVHGGVLEDVRFTGFEYRGDKPRLWAGISRTILMTEEHWNSFTPHGHEVPVALEAGDTETRWLVGTWKSSNDPTEHPVAQAPSLAYAKRLRALRQVKIVNRVDVYRRVTGGWLALIPEGSNGAAKQSRSARPSSSMVTARLGRRAEPGSNVAVGSRGHATATAPKITVIRRRMSPSSRRRDSDAAGRPRRIVGDHRGPDQSSQQLFGASDRR
jgi:hypothetical protein